MESLLQRRRSGLRFTLAKPARLLKKLGVLFLSMTIIFTKTFAQTAPVNPPLGGFKIDGYLRANVPGGSNAGDWVPRLNSQNFSAGADSFVLNNAGTPKDTVTTRLKRDLYNSTSDSVFAQGSKFNDYISALHWTTSSAPDKNDINNGVFHATGDASGNQWVFIGGDRLAVNGTSYIDFEFLQGTVTINSNGTFTGSGSDGGRTDGDINISMEYNNGGTAPLVVIYRWRSSGGTFAWDSTGSSAITDAYAKTNLVTVDVPFGAFGNTTYQPFAFVEAAINITQLLSKGSGTNCGGLSIKTLWIKTKASSTSTAALKDFMSPISLNLNFGGVNIDQKGPVCVDGSNITLTGTPSGGTFSGDGVSGSTFSPSIAGVGTHQIIYTATAGVNCTKSDTMNIVVNPKPTVSVNSPTKCANDSGVTITATPGSGVATDYDYSWTVPAGATDPGNVQSFSATVAGSYSVTITNKTTGCVSLSGSGTLTVNPNPTVTVNSPTKCANDAAVTISATPGSGATTDYNYSWTVPASATAPGNVQSFSATVAGTYSVVITNKTTNCASASGSGTLTVNPNPTVTVNSPAKCSSDPAVTVTATPGSGSGTDYNYAWTVPAGFSDPGNVQSFSTNVAGTYSVIITNKTTGCASASASGTVTVNNNPSAPSVTYNPPACDEATFSITITSVISGATYTVKDKNGAAIAGISPVSPYTAPNGNNITFSNIPAGSGYQVTVSVGDCSSTASSCGSGTITTRNVQSENLINQSSQIGVKAYPNPFNDRVTFVVTSPVGGKGNLEVYNMMGQKIKTVYEGFITKGTQTFELSLPTQQIANLVYVLRIGDQKTSGKLLQINR